VTAVGTRREALEALAHAAARVAASTSLDEALAAIAEAAVEATDADLAVVRAPDRGDALAVRAVAPAASALAAEMAGSRATAAEIDAAEAPAPIRRVAERSRAAGVHVEPARVDGRTVGSVELVRVASPFDASDRTATLLLAAQAALAIRTFDHPVGTASLGRSRWLELAGEALASGADYSRAAQHALRAAVEATDAGGGAIWRLEPSGAVELVGSHGDVAEALPAGERRAVDALAAWRPASVERDEALPDMLADVVTLLLGQPVFAALQLFYPADAGPTDEDLAALGGFATRAAYALRSGERAQEIRDELDRSRSLLEVVSEAIAQLSLAHTLETAVERTAELLRIDQLGVYLLDRERLFAAAGRGLAFGHEDVAERMLELFLGPLRARATLLVDCDGDEPGLARVRASLATAEQQCALGVPLHASGEPIGLLVAYPGSATLQEGDIALLAALAAQLAVAVQNARLHEQAKQLGETLAEVLESERQSTRQLTALYEISRSFAQSLSLDTTLDAVTSTIIEVLNVDAAVIRVPDERGDQFLPHAVHVADSRLMHPVRTILERPQPRPPRTFEPLLLNADIARRLGGAHELLVPFLEKGSTAALLPIATPTELLAQLTILSLDPASPIDDDTLATARTISQQAALAIDNARLYQQQKEFAETMQRSLLPSERPNIPGLDVGTVYESAAQVDVGGDVYDFLERQDGLAVVLGDVTGHGIGATADMAMAKFLFRSLVADHPQPGDFLAHANEVVVREIAPGKFITMAALLITADGNVEAASAGHPEPRLVHADGTVEPMSCGGLALGIAEEQEYEPVRAVLEPGASVVLYTDGAIEARAGRELFGVERLDAVLRAHAGEPAQALADAVLEACRAFSGGGLADDCAVVVIRRA
jgi:serine phosphatase RsbU (regulator of sigma subunit)